MALNSEDAVTVSLHEAGHILAGAAIALPLHSAWLREDDNGIVTGWVEVTPAAEPPEIDSRLGALFILGGLEAEALWREHRSGISLRRARRLTSATYVNTTGDEVELAKCLVDREVDFSRYEAELWMNQLLQANRDPWYELAAALRTHGRLEADMIQSLTASMCTIDEIDQVLRRIAQ